MEKETINSPNLDYTKERVVLSRSTRGIYSWEIKVNAKEAQWSEADFKRLIEIDAMMKDEWHTGMEGYE